MILSDREIQEYVGKKDLIFPFVEEQVTPNGYDLSIEEAELINGSVEKIENNQILKGLGELVNSEKEKAWIKNHLNSC